MCQREEKKRVTFRVVDKEEDIEFVLIRKQHPWSLENVKAIHGYVNMSK